MGACGSKAVHTTEKVNIRARATGQSSAVDSVKPAHVNPAVSPGADTRPCHGLSKPPSLYSLKATSPAQGSDADKSLKPTVSVPRMQDVDMAQLDGSGEAEAEPEDDTIAPLVPVFNQSAPPSSFKRRNMHRHTSGGSAGSVGSGGSSSPPHLTMPAIAGSDASVAVGGTEGSLLLKHSQSTRLPRSVSQSPYAQRGSYRDGASIRRTTSLEGRFRTRSARVMLSRETVETRKAIVSRDLDTNASSSDDDSSDGEPGPKQQQRFVNQ